METNTAITQAESIVRTAASQVLTPGAAECLVCYVDRLLEQHGCDNTHRFTEQYRAASAPRHTALVKRLARMGACCCDCEIFLNAYRPAWNLWTPDRRVEAPDGFVEFIESSPPASMPPCAGVPRGSVKPCEHWERIW